MTSYTLGSTPFAGTTILGQTYNQLGRVLAGIGDVNGDGIDDFILGSTQDSDGSIGGAYLVFGKAGGLGTVDLGANVGSQSVYFQVPNSSVSLLEGVSAAGDVNGDGLADFLIADPRWNDYTGRVYLVYGKASYSGPVNLATLGGADGMIFNGSKGTYEAGDWFGSAISTVGDFNVDGIDDFFIGTASDRYGNNSGNGWVIYGKAGGIGNVNLAAIAPADGFNVKGAPNTFAGGGAADLGDFNGDGYDDFIVTAVGAASFAGKAYIVYGKPGGRGDIDLATFDGNYGSTITGSSFNGIWTPVNRAGDLNGDGLDDVVLIAGSYAFVVFGQAGAPVNVDLSSLTASTGFRIGGEEGITRAASAGDVNGDGYDDLLVASPNYPYGSTKGHAYLIFGKASGFANMTLNAFMPDTQAIKLEGPTMGSGAGQGIGAAGDVNHDGVADFLIGAPLYNGYDGGTFVMYGALPTTAVTRIGAAGGQLIQGGSAGDILDGRGGNDALFGNGGDDRLTGGAGYDQLDGGAGTDTADYSGETGGNRIVVNLSAAPIVDPLSGITVGSQQVLDSFLNLDTLTSIEKVVTGSGGDLVVGGAGTDVFDTGGGADRLDGGGGDDSLTGGSGNDSYVVDTLGDLVVELANGGDDSVETALASYVLADQVETLIGTGFAQSLTGNALANTILGTAGADRLDGGAGADSLRGGGGDDLYIVDEAGDLVVEEAGQGTDEVRTAAAAYSLAGQANVENLTGTSASGQTLTGNEIGNVIIGGMGDDVLNGGAGNDILVGFGGSDTLRGGAGDDVYVIDAADTIVEFAGDGLDEVRTQAEIFVLSDALENLRATSDIGHDFRGNGGNNVIVGGDGNDIVRLQDGGGDLVFGKAGVDSFYFGGAFDNGDFVDGGADRDALILQGNYDLTLSWNITGGSSLANIESISLLSGSVTQYGQSGTNLYSYDLTMVDGNVAAGALMKINGFFLLAGEGLAIDASAETDASLQILAGLGQDTLKGGALGDAFVFGHDGRFGAGDSVDGGGGYDIVYLRGDYAIDFNDAGYAGSLVNVESIALLTSANTEFAGGGDGDFDYSLTWNDDLLAAGGTFTVNGSRLQAHETFVFDGSHETNGTLRVFGGAAADTLTGGGGNDQLHGGTGADLLTGGAGADLFRYSVTSDSTAAASDTIADFVAGQDRIDVNRVDAKANTVGENEAFAFIGTQAFSAGGPDASGELRAFNVSGDLWQVEGDVNGDGVADLVIQVHVAGPELTAADFVL